MITSHFDWLCLTHGAIIQDIDLIIPQLKVVGKCQRTRHYAALHKTLCGATIATDKILGTKLELSGQALFHLRDAGISDSMILSLFAGWRATRADYCFTVDYGSMEPVKNAFDSSGIETNNRKTRLLYMNGAGRGDTAYIGYKSENCVRLYDKGRELKLLGQALMRVELQTRGRYARALKHESIKTGNPSSVARSMIKSRIKFLDCDWYNHALQGELVEVKLEPKNEPSMLKWLRKTVKPALAKYSNQFGKQELHKFLLEVATENGL